jgi:hypothetical protein
MATGKSGLYDLSLKDFSLEIKKIEKRLEIASFLLITK